MLPHKNPLPKPELVTTPEFETLLAAVKAEIIEYVQTNDPDSVDAVTATLGNEAELMTKFCEAFTVILQNHTRQINNKAVQMFGMYATEDDQVDVIASQLAVTRQVIDPGDASAYPVVAPTMESNDSLLTRYYLAAFALASTGTRSGYRYHAMTLDARPDMSVESPAENKLVVTYEFPDNDLSGKTKDAQARMVQPGAVDVYILTHDGQGIPDETLLAATHAYLTREDIGQETDLITVKAPEIKTWSCEATLYIRPGADTNQIQALAETAVRTYAAKQHMLGSNIEPSMLYSVLIKATGAHRADLVQPDALRCAYSEAPYLESVNITVNTENV